MRTVKEYIIDSRAESSDRFFIVPPVVCRDGFHMSVQHSSYHYCHPQFDFAERKGLEFVSYEVGYPSEKVDILMPFAENPEQPTSTVYAYVPAQIVEQVVEMHGGLADDDRTLSIRLKSLAIDDVSMLCTEMLMGRQLKRIAHLMEMKPEDLKKQIFDGSLPARDLFRLSYFCGYKIEGKPKLRNPKDLSLMEES